MVEACGDTYEYLEMDSVRVKGKHEPITIYTAMTHEQAAARAGEISLHKEALALYKAMRFAEAVEHFARLKELTGNETLYDLYAERCQTLIDNPPAEGWDGVYTYTTK
jgi:adenylate cyclase